MNEMNRFLALVIGVLVAGLASADWIEDSEEMLPRARPNNQLPPDLLREAVLQNFVQSAKP